MARRLKYTYGRLPFSSDEELSIWNELRKKSLGELKKGEYLYELLKLGFSPIHIDSMLDLRVITIEKRCIEFLKQKEDNYEDFKFLFEQCDGLPYIDIINRFFRCSFKNLEDFCHCESINYKIFKVFYKDVENIQYVKDCIEAKNQKHNNVIIHKGGHIIRPKLVGYNIATIRLG